MGKRVPMPDGRWDEVMRRDRVCQASAYGFGSVKACSHALVVHHMVLRGSGGSGVEAHDADRLVVLCETHHLEVHAFPARSYDCGLMVRRNVPVSLWKW